jgi:glycine cleavage system regulatory protein
LSVISTKEESMKAHIIATIVCPDRPGIVERLTEVARVHSANWEQSRMARLGGDFAGIVALSVVSDRADALAEALRSLADDHTTVTVRVTSHLVPQELAAHLPYRLTLSGADHVGIVNQVARAIAAKGVNVEELETEVVPAPVTGAPLFRMEALLLAPPSVTLASLRSELARLADELAVDLDVEPAR